MNGSLLFPDDFLDEAAFLLLSSSTVSRYGQMAKSLAARSPSRKALQCGAVTPEDLIEEAAEEWAMLIAQDERDISEVKLAVLLSVISDTALAEVDTLLLRIAVQDMPPAAWVSALARRLSRDRSANQVFRVSHHGRTVETITVQQNPADQRDFSLLLADSISVVSPNRNADDKLSYAA